MVMEFTEEIRPSGYLTINIPSAGNWNNYQTMAYLELECFDRIRIDWGLFRYKYFACKVR